MDENRKEAKRRRKNHKPQRSSASDKHPPELESFQRQLLGLPEVSQDSVSGSSTSEALGSEHSSTSEKTRSSTASHSEAATPVSFPRKMASPTKKRSSIDEVQTPPYQVIRGHAMSRTGNISDQSVESNRSDQIFTPESDNDVESPTSVMDKTTPCPTTAYDWTEGPDYRDLEEELFNAFIDMGEEDADDEGINTSEADMAESSGVINTEDHSLDYLFGAEDSGVQLADQTTEEQIGGSEESQELESPTAFTTDGEGSVNSRWYPDNEISFEFDTTNAGYESEWSVEE